MSNTVKIGLLIILAALVAMILRGFFIAASKPAEPQQASVDRIRVAAADLPRGLLLRDDDLAWKTVPHGTAPAGAVIDGPQHDVVLKGAVLRHAVTAGTTILAADVIQANAPGFLSATLHPDMRAVSVAIDDVSGNAGLIQPGDYVDLLLTQSMQGKTDSPDESVSSETVVQRARVLAVGSELSPTKDVTDSNRSARTVTLEVSPHTAEAIAVAARLGSLSLALRSFATLDRSANAASAADATSDALPSAQPVWAGDISRALRALPSNARGSNAAPGSPLPTGPIAPPPVAIYRGSNETTQTSDGSGAVSVTRGGNGGASGGPTIGVPPLPLTGAAAQTFGVH